MKKIIALFTALVMSMLLANAPAAQAAGLYNKWGQDSDSKTIGVAQGNDLYLKTTIQYRATLNKNTGKRWVKPVLTIAMYNRSGTRMNCGVWRIFGHLEVNPYFWDASGRNFNPGKFRVNCDESTINSNSQHYELDNVPRLFFVDGAAPRWKVNIDVIEAGVDEHTTLSGRMHWPLR